MSRTSASRSRVVPVLLLPVLLVPVLLVAALIAPVLIAGGCAGPAGAARPPLASTQPVARAPNTPPPGFTAIFDGATLDGWRGLVGNPITRAAMSETDRAAAQSASDAAMRAHWRVEDGEIVNDGHGPHLCTSRDYGDFEMLLDWKIAPGADSGVYLRGSPQVQIWDPVNGSEAARVGSGGLFNNERHPSAPSLRADRPAGVWNTFRILMIGEIVTVDLNGKRVVDAVPLENYWDRARPIFPRGQIELQTHGGEIRFRNVFLREIDGDEANAWLDAQNDDGMTPLFNGRDLAGWMRATEGYFVDNGALICDPERGGTVMTVEEFDDFTLHFEFLLPPGGNNGLAVRAPIEGDSAYEGFELQVLDNTAAKYANLKPYQYHGSLYGVAPAHRGYQRPVGAWNFQEVECQSGHVRVTLNGTTILDVDIDGISETMDGRPHPGLHRPSGRLGFMGHGDRVAFRNVRIRRE